MDAGCDFFIAKPINPDILFNNIEQAFEKYQ